MLRFELQTLETLYIGKRGLLFPRSYYANRPCPSTELVLHRDCIRTFHNYGWNVIAHEWKAKTHDGRNGVGDLVFQRGRTFLVMECKRRDKQKVYDQAAYYAQAWAEKEDVFATIVLFGIWTCKHQELLGRLVRR